MLGLAKVNRLPNVFCQSIINCSHGAAPYMHTHITTYTDYINSMLARRPDEPLLLDFPQEGSLLREKRLIPKIYQAALWADKHPERLSELVPAFEKLADEAASPINKSYALNELAKCHRASGREKEAFLAAIEAVWLNPDNLSINDLLADIHYKRKEFHQVAAYGQKALSGGGLDRFGGRMSLSTFAKTIAALNKISTPPLAVHTLARRALAFYPDSYDLHFQVAARLMDAGQYGKSVVEFEKIVEKYPRQLAPYSCLVKINLQLKKYARAEHWLSALSALDQYPKDYYAHYIRALFLYETGKLTQARQAIQRSLTLNASYVNAKQLAKQIEELFIPFDEFEQLKLVYDDLENFSRDDYEALVCSVLPPVETKNGAIFTADLRTPKVNFCDGMRRTVGVPKTYRNSIFLMGDSRLLGYWCHDADCINGHLQSLCNAAAMDLRVVNYACIRNTLDMIWMQLQAIDLKPGDQVAVIQGPVILNTKEPHCEFALALYEYCQARQVHFMIFPMFGLPYLPPWSTREKLMLMINPFGNYADKDNPQSLPHPDNAQAMQRRYDAGLRRWRALGCPVTDLNPVFRRPHTMGEIYVDGGGHFTHRANKAVARTIFNSFTVPCAQMAAQDAFSPQEVASRKLASLLVQLNKDNLDLKRWLSAVPHRELPEAAVVGSIVMNCNPFTYGHQYLIETAAAQVDLLYIFVVEEDKSDFPFKDRFRLVQEGTRHLSEKVLVMPSGQFIISSISFEEYFRKDRISEKIDPSGDVAIFGALIAPALGITRRFVGEEPNCNVTRQYNETMLRLLPGMGVDVHVIPRKAQAGMPISASSVRRYMKAGDAGSVRKIVPPSTYEYLREKKYISQLGRRRVFFAWMKNRVSGLIPAAIRRTKEEKEV